uniref:Transmembrane protein n=1 Tax=Tetraselmis sp. GSL018 TaxID=582737 RepID=A0A061QQD1_9CHLO|mmetsp:Transcript_9109/g.21936  ORF Transcript_9109/g.21936 Transcript_9109/m.21936 type:complete len:998 (+) Transcript_9109:210-3203(+)|eukprot:CAMPEP_0177622968 /NCGR_PEP_ID=MMETSP0419_2-20121207/28640_1 /TAXON_ID=582737 /ORGANISM="Tetraselmis sp., Strain GSL018" /LENGTH=997 /DNA_ID=CAMNT_0019123465 /DNA_START=144 /DNA_END=3137 /DNA_ORIENTATION=+
MSCQKEETSTSWENGEWQDTERGMLSGSVNDQHSRDSGNPGRKRKGAMKLGRSTSPSEQSSGSARKDFWADNRPVDDCYRALPSGVNEGNSNPSGSSLRDDLLETLQGLKMAYFELKDTITNLVGPQVVLRFQSSLKLMLCMVILAVLFFTAASLSLLPGRKISHTNNGDKAQIALATAVTRQKAEERHEDATELDVFEKPTSHIHGNHSEAFLKDSAFQTLIAQTRTGAIKDREETDLMSSEAAAAYQRDRKDSAGDTLPLEQEGADSSDPDQPVGAVAEDESLKERREPGSEDAESDVDSDRRGQPLSIDGGGVGAAEQPAADPQEPAMIREPQEEIFNPHRDGAEPLTNLGPDSGHGNLFDPPPQIESEAAGGNSRNEQEEKSNDQDGVGGEVAREQSFRDSRDDEARGTADGEARLSQSALKSSRFESEETDKLGDWNGAVAPNERFASMKQGSPRHGAQEKSSAEPLYTIAKHELRGVARPDPAVSPSSLMDRETVLQQSDTRSLRRPDTARGESPPLPGMPGDGGEGSPDSAADQGEPEEVRDSRSGLAKTREEEDPHALSSKADTRYPSHGSSVVEADTGESLVAAGEKSPRGGIDSVQADRTHSVAAHQPTGERSRAYSPRGGGPRLKSSQAAMDRLQSGRTSDGHPDELQRYAAKDDQMDNAGFTGRAEQGADQARNEAETHDTDSDVHSDDVGTGEQSLASGVGSTHQHGHLSEGRQSGDGPAREIRRQRVSATLNPSATSSIARTGPQLSAGDAAEKRQQGSAVAAEGSGVDGGGSARDEHPEGDAASVAAGEGTEAHGEGGEIHDAEMGEVEQGHVHALDKDASGGSKRHPAKQWSVGLRGAAVGERPMGGGATATALASGDQKPSDGGAGEGAEAGSAAVGTYGQREEPRREAESLQGAEGGVKAPSRSQVEALFKRMSSTQGRSEALTKRSAAVRLSRPPTIGQTTSKGNLSGSGHGTAPREDHPKVPPGGTAQGPSAALGTH